MLGAIIGDIVGSPYEFDEYNIKTTEFPLFSAESEVTDDTIMTLAVAEGLLNGWGDMKKSRQEVIKSMKNWGRSYPAAGYGEKFGLWLHLETTEPYNSFGNGSAMRVAAVGWLFNKMADVLKYAELTAAVTHNHPEGIKGAKAVAAAIFMARHGEKKLAIKEYISRQFDYDLTRTCDEIRPDYYHIESCQKTVPEAITAFLEGNSFEEVIRLAVSLGGDSDTLTAIAGSIAEAYFGIPGNIAKQAISRLDDRQLAMLKRFNNFISEEKER